MDHDATVITDPEGIPSWGAGMTTTLRDTLRYGNMLLHEGKNAFGEQVVPANVVDELFQADPDPAEVELMQQRYAASSEGGRNNNFVGLEGWVYKNQHRLLPDRILWFEGFWGQELWVDRQQDLIIVTQSSNQNFATNAAEHFYSLLAVTDAFESGLLPAPKASAVSKASAEGNWPHEYSEDFP